MKISINGKEILNLSDDQLKVLKNDMFEETFDEEIERRVCWVVMHKFEGCLRRLRSEWEPKLKERKVKSVPLDDEEFAAFVFLQPDYKSRSLREDPSE